MYGSFVHLFGGHFGSKYRLRERTTFERSDEDDGFKQYSSLGSLVHHQYFWNVNHRHFTDHRPQGELEYIL